MKMEFVSICLEQRLEREVAKRRCAWGIQAMQSVSKKRIDVDMCIGKAIPTGTEALVVPSVRGATDALACCVESAQNHPIISVDSGLCLRTRKRKREEGEANSIGSSFGCSHLIVKGTEQVGSRCDDHRRTKIISASPQLPNLAPTEESYSSFSKEARVSRKCGSECSPLAISTCLTHSMQLH